MKEKLEGIKKEALALIENADKMDKLNEVKVAYLGKKGQPWIPQVEVPAKLLLVIQNFRQFFTEFVRTLLYGIVFELFQYHINLSLIVLFYLNIAGTLFSVFHPFCNR